ncbi:MAG: peptidylprolyl isomerase [Pseudomonadales bacterium]|nr:peptidylprolyl isomerase [Pseudomonadales bacterium]
MLGTSALYAEQKELPKNNPRVLLATDKGDIVLELYPRSAPMSVKNFLQYVDSGFYSDTVFHRIIRGFMIQGGGFDKDMMRKETKGPVKNEADNGLSNRRGTLAMARTNDVNSATSQFFINHTDNKFLDYQGDAKFGYAVFGKVTDGIDVVDRIAGVATKRAGAPVRPVVIKSITRIPENPTK